MPKGDLPPLPQKKYTDQQATIRHGTSAGAAAGGGAVPLTREPSDEDDYGTAYASQNHHELDDDLPDTTMLDSVVLPAIASVSAPFLLLLLRGHGPPPPAPALQGSRDPARVCVRVYASGRR